MKKENLKSKIIPENIKENIDEVLEEQLFNANRYYAESNANIYELMQIEAKKSPIEFLKELKARWNWHNNFYEDLLEPVVVNLINENINEYSPRQISELIEIYKTCCLVDEATLVTSGAIKKHLEYNLPYIPVNTENTKIEDAVFMLLTPPIETFFAQFQIDHLSYIYLLKTDGEKAKRFKKYLLNKYHANDEQIFKGRFNKKFSKKAECSAEQLIEDINSYKINDDYKIKHFYFTLEHPERKAFRDLIVYDNVDEKFISSQLIGISGFLFRKRILDYLNFTKKIENNGYIYELSNESVISALDNIKQERMVRMEKNVKPYRQRGMTCAISCMLMVLEYYKIIPKADWLYERKYYRAYHSEYMDGTPFSALAWHFAKNGLDTELIHSEKKLFSNESQLLTNECFEDAMIEYKRYLEGATTKGAKIKNGSDISCAMLKEKLENGKMVILAGQAHECLHAILLCGYNENGFVVCDPLFKQKRCMSPSQIDEYMNTPLGKWCVVVGEQSKSKEMLIESLPKFQEEATEKMNISTKQSSAVNSKNKIMR